jgi:hypothetical protein
MKRILSLVFVVTLIAAAAGCVGESAASKADSSSKAAAVRSDKPKPEPRVTIPAGTRLRVSLIDGVSTTKSSPGDRFMASLSEPVIVDGKMVLDKGTKVRGRVIDVKESGRVKGRATIQLRLTEIVREDGKGLAISTKAYTAVAEATKKRDTGMIAGGAGLGAAIGALTGGGKGAAVGAAIGGGAGTGAVLATKGKDIHYGPETRLNFTLASPTQI